MAKAETVHLDGNEEIDFPTIDEMRRAGKVVVVKASLPLAAQVTRLFQESVLRGNARPSPRGL
jgi:hypothetical protein